MRSLIPPRPTEAEAARGASELRYEDVGQDGRLLLVAVPNVLGGVLWPRVMRDAATAGALRDGIVPILSRFVVEAEADAGPIAVQPPLEIDGAWVAAHGGSATGTSGTADSSAAESLYLLMWADAHAPRGRTYDPPPRVPAAERERVLAARLYAEHVLTRPFAPPGARRVTRLPDAPGLPPSGVPPLAWQPRAWDAPLTLPHGATPLDAAPVDDAAEIHFGLDHTDSNQHVNSLVYLRLFVDAALRRVAAHGPSSARIARRLEVAYRKPLFAGDRARVRLLAFRTTDGALGAAGAFVPTGASLDARPHATLQVLFTP